MGHVSNNTGPARRISYTVEDYYVVFILSLIFTIVSVFICTLILILIYRSKPRLHTVNHMLVCNTCIASIFYCIVINNNYIFLIFMPWQTDHMSCRWRAYFGYASIAAVVYSYLIQAMSRLFFSVLSVKYRCLTTFRAHYFLIVSKWILALLIASPSIITKDILYYPNTLCWVSLDHTIHLAYTVVVYYIAPVFSIIFIYVYIYFRIRRAIKCSTTLPLSARRQQIDLELLRNILILTSIYIGGGLPFFLFVVTSIKAIYLLNLVTLSLTLAVEKSCTILLDREIRHVFKNFVKRRTRVAPPESKPININRKSTFQLAIIAQRHV